jgi:hypothetical protein
MKLKYLIPLVVGVWLCSYGLVLLSPAITGKIMESLILPMLSIMSGLLIGAVGVFLGSLGNLYSLLPVKDRNLGPGDLSAFFGLITCSVREVKHDVLFTVVSLAASVFLAIIRESRSIWLPGPRWLNKDLVIGSLVIALTALVFFAIVDCIRAMFALHGHYQAVMEASLNRSDQPRDASE